MVQVACSATHGNRQDQAPHQIGLDSLLDMHLLMSLASLLVEQILTARVTMDKPPRGGVQLLVIRCSSLDYFCARQTRDSMGYS